MTTTTNQTEEDYLLSAEAEIEELADSGASQRIAAILSLLVKALRARPPTTTTTTPGTVTTTP